MFESLALGGGQRQRNGAPTAVRAKAWSTIDDEPNFWQIDTTDAGAADSAGDVLVRTFTDGPEVEFVVDDLRVYDAATLSSAAPLPPP